MSLALMLAVTGFLMPFGLSGQVRLLKCHSVNRVPGPDVTEFLFIPTKADDCAFIFEGPEGSMLDMEVKSVAFPKQMAGLGGCRKSKLTVYNYLDSKIVLGKFLCQENEKSNVITKSNMGVVTSSVTDGSFSLKIKPTYLNAENDLVAEIDGMSAPDAEAQDFFFEHRSNNIDGGFRPLVWRETEEFRPSLPEQPDAEPLHDSNRYYFGKPTAHIDLTYNSTGFNFTASPIRPPRPTRPARPPRPGHNHGHHHGHTTTPASHPESSTANHESTTRPTVSNATEHFRPTVPAEHTTPHGKTTTDAPEDD